MCDMRSFVRFHQSETGEELRHEIKAFIRKYGYDKYVIASVSPVKSALVDRIYLIDGAWLNDDAPVKPDDYLIHCPITRNILVTDEAFYWSKTHSKAGERYRVVSRPAGAGVHGIQVPVFGRSGLSGAASFGGAQIDSSPLARMTMTMAGIVAYGCAQRLSQLDNAPEDRKLSVRVLNSVRI